MLKGKIQINLNDGRTILTEKKDFKVGDSVLIELPSQKIKQTIKLEKGSLVYLTGGKHIGEIGVIEEFKDNIIVYKRNNQKHETLKKYALVVGKNKPLISLEAKK